ncbi:glycosyltransferase family 1 protein [Actinotalea sp. BY-33]|uniref:Glycosyltransferase family 1 protein n=1 Tax=Actinotalea soli TaxID=2819234 RepID=A0A939RU00_9CELL|nr:glycosyltransferase [Actinotalea soli]MBO1751989.1 glycosyltransferase family 1 protein [Actinotalea soli]
MSSRSRAVVLSRRALEQKVWQASQYELEDVICAVEDATLLAPGGRRASGAGALVHGAVNRVGRRVGRSRRAPMVRVDEAVETDLFFGVFAAAHELGALPLVRPQLERSAAKVAFIVELWTPQVPQVEDYLRLLRGFDHVFLFSRDAAAAVEAISGVPCTYLPTAVDVDLFAPPVPAPVRGTDVMSYGRRLDGTHEALLAAAAAGSLHYQYDTVRGPFDVTGPREHRAALARSLQRSRYSVVYKNNDEPGRVGRTAGEESLTNRYFESLAAGAVLLGSAPAVADFARCFDWPDALVEIAAPEPRVVDVIGELDGDPLRVARASRAGVVESLRRHDWAHRWAEVLSAVGLEPGPGLTGRLEHLEARAREHESAPLLIPG